VVARHKLYAIHRGVTCSYCRESLPVLGIEVPIHSDNIQIEYARRSKILKGKEDFEMRITALEQAEELLKILSDLMQSMPERKFNEGEVDFRHRAVRDMIIIAYSDTRQEESPK
jgi:hypothetical protein